MKCRKYYMRVSVNSRVSFIRSQCLLNGLFTVNFICFPVLSRMSFKSGVLPQWLCEKSLQKVLESKLNRSCQVISVNGGKGSTAGDHYLSEIVRLKVRVQEDEKQHTIYLIIKDVCGGWNDVVAEINAIEKEVEVYTELIPLANRVLPEPVAADCYFVSPNSCLLLEDLTNLGYKLVDRRQQLDYDHSKAALRSLAQFHAASVKLLELSPQSLRVAGEETCFVHRKDTITYNLNKHCIKTALRTLANHEEGREFVHSLKSFDESFWADAREVVNGDFEFKVLNHGDFWLTNILFKYEGDKVTHCRLVDFQLTRYCTPCYDIHLLIATSIKSNVREKHMNELLDDYILTLNSTLKDIGSSKYFSRGDLEKSMDRTKVIGILFGLSLSPVVLLDPKNPLQLDGCTKEEICGGFKNCDPYKNVCNNDVFLNHIISLLKYYKRKNYL